MRFFKKLIFQLKNNYYTKLVTAFFGIITFSLLLLMFIFSWHQIKTNENEKLDYDYNSFSRFTQIVEKKVLSDVYDIMYKGVLDILPFDTLSDYNAKNPFIYSNNPFDTTLSYKNRLYKLQQVYPYIGCIDIYSCKFDTYISSSGSVFFNAVKRRDDLKALVPYHILDSIKNTSSGYLWISPAQNNEFDLYANFTSFVQRLPLFSSPSSNDIYIIINIDPSVIYNDYFKNMLPDNSYFYIVDQDGNIILKTSSEEYLSTALNNSKHSEEIKKSTKGTDKFIYEKAEYNIIWQASSLNHWKYIYISKRPSTITQLISSLGFVITWFIIIFISSIVIIVLVSKLIYKPIDMLLKYINSLLNNSDNGEKGDLEKITDAFTFINSQLVNYKETINRNSPLLLNNIAISLLDGNVKTIEELNSWLSILNLKFDHKAFFIFIIKIDPEIYENLNNENKDFFLLYIRKQVEDYYNLKNPNTLKFISYYSQDEVIPFIVNLNEEQYHIEKDAALEILSNMDDQISKFINIAVSDIITDFSQFNRKYKAALSYFKYVFICGNKNVFDRDTVEKFNYSDIIYDTSFKKKFKTLLKLCKFDELKTEIAEFYNNAKAKKYSYSYLQSLSSEIIGILTNEFQSNDIDIPYFDEGDLMSSFSKLKSIDQCADWYSNIIDIYAEGIENKMQAIDNEYMQSILEYIDKDITNVTLNSVSDKFKISTAHFSRMFKKQTGKNFSDYVTEKRLEHACHLLVTTDMKISDIVNKMGYQNINYFNKIFKLKYNLTPTQYRKQHSTYNEN